MFARKSSKFLVKILEFKKLENLDGLEKMEPLGITVHYLGSHDVASAVNHLRTNNLAYHVIIDRAGVAWQMANFERRVNHAGVASWRGKSPNRSHIAVAVSSWGQLKFEDKKLKTWAGTLYAPESAIYRAGNLGLAKTWWDGITEPQELALMDCLKHLIHSHKIDSENVCGHDECALPHGRKSDPGGVLPFKMSELRAILKAQVSTT